MFRKRRHRTRGTGRAKADKLLTVLLDGYWHATSELVRRVGHTFFVAKWVLVHLDGFPIEARRHPGKSFEWQYRLKDAAAAGTVEARARHQHALRPAYAL